MKGDIRGVYLDLLKRKGILYKEYREERIMYTCNNGDRMSDDLGGLGQDDIYLAYGLFEG